jgi:hypothetical protein
MGMESKQKCGRWIALGLVVGLVLAWGGFTVADAVIPSQGGVIKGCYKKNGNLRVIDSSASCKAGKETAIQWNQTGAAGQSGLYSLLFASTFAFTGSGCPSGEYRLATVRTWGSPFTLTGGCSAPQNLSTLWELDGKAEVTGLPNVDFEYAQPATHLTNDNVSRAPLLGGCILTDDVGTPSQSSLHIQVKCSAQGATAAAAVARGAQESDPVATQKVNLG